MTWDRVPLIVAAAALVILVVRVLGPPIWGIVRRSQMHGPAGVGSPNSGGRWLGWMVSLFWSVAEGKREEQWEYMRRTRIDTWDEDLVKERPDPLPQYARDARPVTSMSGDSFMSRDHQQLTEDGNHWWSGRGWVPTSRFVPPSAPRSTDGSHWWDGAQWRWMPNEFATAERFLPRHASLTREDAAQDSWLIRRRGHAADRWVLAAKPRLPERSDPPPQNLPPIADPYGSVSDARRRRRWRRRRA